MKKLVTLILFVGLCAISKAQLPKLENNLKSVYRKELDSLAKVYKIKNPCGLIKTFNDNGTVPARESITILYKDARGQVTQQFLYTRDVH